MGTFTTEQLRLAINILLDRMFSVQPETATPEQLYEVLVVVLRDYLAETHRHHAAQTYGEGAKQIHYLSMEFLVGRSLKNNIHNLGIAKEAEEAIERSGYSLDDLYEQEPDAGLGNGGLGRLAACYLDALATGDYSAYGYSILYEFGIFKQHLINGWQQEEMDNWLPGGGVWLVPRRDERVEIRFGGTVEEIWNENYLHVKHTGYESVMAVPHDLYISGYDSKGVSKLRLWRSASAGIDMESFNRGDYAGATRSEGVAELISKVLYPNDNHLEGRVLRLRQQYFFCSASVSDIVRKHLSHYGTLDNFADKNAIHINDTHPTLAIPELMRVLLDECGYQWDRAMDIVKKTFSYTNHTVMSEAMEQWSADILQTVLPRIYQIIAEIDRRASEELGSRFGGDFERISRMRVIEHGSVRMANLCVLICHSVNGVSAIHTDILKNRTFHDYYGDTPSKFINVTNGIAYRRWLLQSNPDLTRLLSELIGEGFRRDAGELARLARHQDDPAVLSAIRAVKQQNKQRLANYINKTAGYPVDPESIFDVQAKRMHEYKRQHLNALHILHRYLEIKNGNGGSFLPHTYIFGAKAAPGYYMAKQMIRFICGLGELLEKDPDTRDLMRIVFLEDYRVTVSEILMPAADISQQISLAGTEASGTGNMKLMLDGAVTLGTLDGANVEIREAAGDENFLLFGMKEQEVRRLQESGYDPMRHYLSDTAVREAFDFIDRGFGGSEYPEIANLRHHDPYLALADFESYLDAHNRVDALYADSARWSRMSLLNTANAGRFSADRAVRQYADMIWHARPVK